MKLSFLLAAAALAGLVACSGEAPPAAEARGVDTAPAAPSEYDFLTEEAPDGERADVLVATAGGVEHRLESYGYRLGAVVIQEDLNGDGTVDAIIAVHSGGNCCPADYAFVADMGADRVNGRYAITSIPDVYAWDDPVALQENGKPMVRFVSSNEGMHTDDYAETVHLFRFEGAKPVLVSETETEELPALAELRSSAFEEEPVGVGRRSFSFDLNDDGVEDEITCSLWERWGG